MSGSQHLAQMANDIGDFFRAQPRGDAVAGIANHLKSYWTPKMRAQLAAQVQHGDIALDELPREALRVLVESPNSAPSQPAGGDAG